MNIIKKWLKAFRLRTLPLSLSGIVFSSIYAFNNPESKGIVIALALSTTLFLQILSNLANDYGDFKNGADNDKRVGPSRSVQSGEITLSSMKNMIIAFVVLSVISGGLLLHFSFGVFSLETSIFIGLGLAAVWAALKYTAGKNPYGYRGLGDIFVFIFFGLVSVSGSHFLYTQSFSPEMLLPACAIGFLATAVLNLNNMRDMIPDQESGKITIPVNIGFKNAKIYHMFLVLIPFMLSTWFISLHNTSVLSLLHYILILPLLIHLRFVFITKVNQKLDSELKKVAIMTLLFAILLAVGTTVHC